MILFSSYLFYFCFLFLGTVKTQCLTQISSSTTSCLFCSHNYYDSKASEHFLQTSPQINAHDCIIKSNSSSERNVLVTNGISFDATSVNTYDQIYGDLFEAFYNESIIASSYFNASITFLLSKGQHFISKNSLNKSNEFIFRRVNANILIKPVFCSEFNILNLCTNEKNIIIKIKSLNFSFIISKKLEIQNIDFDAVDSYYNNNTENNTCINQNISCCEENSLRDPTNSCYINFSRHSYLSQNNENEKNYYGFFSLEAIFDDPDYSIPEIALKNVSFIDFYIFEPLETSFMSVIIIDYFGGSLMIKNLLISNSFFRYPIIIYNSTISLKKDYYKFDKFGQFLNNYNQNLKSFQKINIENLEITNYNIFGYEYNIINDFTTGIILLNNYGSNEISLKNIFFSNITTIQNNYLFYFENITGNLSNFILKNITNLTLFHFKNSKISIDDFIILESTWVNYAIYCFDTSTLLLLQFQFLNSSVFKITVPNIFFFGSNSQVVFDNNSFNNLVCLSFDFRNSLVYFYNSTFSNLIMKNSEFYFLDTHLALFDSKWVNITGFTYLFYFVSCSQLEITNNIITELSGSYFISGTSLTTVLIKSSTFSNLKNFNYLLNKYTVFENIFIENSKFKQISLSTALIYSVTELNLSISHSQFSNVSLISSKSTNFICVQVGQELIQNSSFTNIIFLAGGTAVINFKVSMVLVKDSIFENCGFAYPINILDFKSIEYVNMMYIWTCIEIVIHNNSFINKGAVNLFSGFIHCTLALVKVSVIGNIFQYKDKIADVYYTGLIFSNAPIIIFNNNKFHNLQCPEFPSFIHNNGAVTLQGDSTYNPMKNKKIASLNNNSFFGCTCKKGGSLGIINYDYVYVTNLYIYNSSSSLGGSILLTCSTFAQFKNILINSTYGNQAHTINLKYIGYLYFGNFVINNGFSQSNGGIKVRDVDSLLINLMNVFNSSTLDSGGVFNIKIGNTQIINSLFVRCFASLTGGMVYLSGTGNLSLMNVTVENSSSKMGGAIYLEDSNQLFISQSIFNQTFSIEQGGALYVNLIQNLSLISTYFTFCESWTNGIIYFKNSENEANYNINGLVCLENVANSGSCIFSETRGNLTLNNFQISENLNNSIYFISSFNMFVDLTNGSVRNCFSNAHILYGNNIFLTVSQVIFENNSILLSVVFLEGLKISKLEKIVFNNNERLKKSQPTPLINSLTSDVNISEMQFNQSLNSIFWTFVLSAEESNIILSNIIISDQNHDDQSLILSDSGTFQLSFASFIRCQGPILKIIHANILIDQSIFIDNLQGTYSFIADITIAGFFEQNMIVWISNSTFHPKNSLSTSITDVAKFIFDGCNFNGDYTGQGLRIISASNIVISNSLFSNLINVKDGGGAIWSSFSTSRSNSKIKILNSSFISNKACFGGALFFEGMYDLTLKNSYFQNNTVSKSSQSKCGIAAAGMLECSPYLSCFFDLEGNKFLDNKAELLVPTIFSKSFLNQTNNLFINNSDGLNFTENISSFPLKITLRSQNPNLTYFSSGETFSLAFNLKDSLNQNFFTKANSTGIIMKSSNETDLTLINTISLSTHYGIFNFSGLEIIKTPNTSFYLEIRLSIYDEITSENFFFSETFIYFSRPCQIGELITTDLQCKMCQHTYYSLIDPMQNPKIHKCTKCEPNAYCPGGRYLIPLSGYWRFSSLSSKIIKCSTREACTGPPEIETSKLFSNMSLYSFNKSFIHGSCFEGHEGNLCFKCIDGYGKTSNNGLCSICEDIEIITYVKLIITLLIILVYSLLNLKALMNVSKSDENSEVIGIVSKICINHLQKMSIMTNFNINVITVDIESFLSFLNTVSFLNENNFSNECFLKKFFTDTEKFYIYKIFFSFVIPIIESFLCLLVLIILEIWIHFRKNQSFLNIKKIYLIFLISCYIFYPFVTKCSLSMINCIYLDESHNKYLYASPNVICWEGFHKQVFFIIGFLGILVWGLFFPVILAYLIGRNMKNIQHPEKQEITSNIIIKIPNLHNQPELFIDRNNDTKFKINEKNDKKFPDLKGSNKKNNHKTNQIEETNEKKEVFLFFYKDYKTEFYYWESIIFMQKFFLTLLPNISEIVGDTIDVIFVLIMALYTFFLLKIYPFKISKLNNLELFSILITVMSRVLLLLINFFFKDSNAVSVISAMLILINIFFFLAAIYCIYKYTIWKKFFGAYKKKYDFLKKAVRYMRNFISRKNDKSNGDFSLGNKNSLDQSVVNVNVVINETKRQKSKFAKNLETQIVPIK